MESGNSGGQEAGLLFSNEGVGSDSDAVSEEASSELSARGSRGECGCIVGGWVGKGVGLCIEQSLAVGKANRHILIFS